MRFGPVPAREAAGALAAHSIKAGDLVIRKGSLITEATATALAEAGIGSIVTVRLEPGDVGEDVAASRVAVAVAGPGIRIERAFTGRANLFATEAGLLLVNEAAIDALNAVDEAVAQVEWLVREKGVRTICVHGDNPRAVAFATAVRAALLARGYTLQPFA